MKVYAISVMTLSVTFAVVFAFDKTPVRLFLIALALVGAVVILTRPTTENVLAEA